MDNREMFQMINEAETKKLLNILRCKTNIEKTVLAKEMGVSFQTLVKQMETLKENNILRENNQAEINSLAFYACGISIGGAQCKITLVDAAYKVIDSERFENLQKEANIFKQDFLHKGTNKKINAGYRYFETPDNLNQLSRKLNSLIEDIITLHDLGQQKENIPPILSIGIAFTGSIDAKNQIILKSHNVSYLQNEKPESIISMNHMQELRDREIALTIDHNAKALAVCEKYSLYDEDNSNKEYQRKANIAALYLGSGIGCGLILNNRLERGCSNLNGELGHIVVPRYSEFQNKELKNSTCTCGGVGCLEQYIISDGFGMTREEFKQKTSEEIIEKFNSLSTEERNERLSALGYYWGWVIDLCVKFLNVGLIIFSGKMTCIIDEVLNYTIYPSGNNEKGLLDLSKIISKYGALAPTIGAGILSTYFPNENIEWPEIEG